MPIRRPIVALVVAASALLVAAPAHAADSCANAAYRAGAGAGLPACRAWEQVTPVDKGGVSASPVYPVAAAPSGNGAAFTLPGAFPGAESATYNSLYSSQRGLAWSTVALDPPIDTNGRLLYSAAPTVSADGSRALVVTPRRLTPNAVEGNTNFYLRSVADRGYRLLYSQPGRALYSEVSELGGVYYADGDLEHVLIASSLLLTPKAVDGVTNLYEVGDGALKLVSAFSNGNGLPGGVLASSPEPGRRPVSADGRRVTFEGIFDASAPGTAIYQRSGTTTKLISRSHRAGDTVTQPQVSDTPWASADGQRVDFRSGAPLTPQSPANDTTGRLYRWNAAGDELTDLLAGVIPSTVSANANPALQVSPDGRYVWFTSVSKLTSTAQADVDNLYVLDTASSPRRLTRVATFDPSSGATVYGGQSYNWSADGTKVAIRTASPVTGFNNANAACVDANNGSDGACIELFTFDATKPAVAASCASCGARPIGDVGDLGTRVGGFSGIASHVIDNSGRVFFDTPTPLATDDANQLSDVYTRDPGQPARLLSSGTSAKPALLGDVSPTGDNVFFYTDDPLVPQDGDRLTDLYDARVGGGLASQQVTAAAAAPCQGGECRGPQPSAPARPAPGPASPAVARAPAFRVGRPSSSVLRAAARGGTLRLSVRLAQAGKLSARASARLGRTTRTVARGSRTARRAGTLALTLKLSKAARRELARRKRLKLTLRVAYSRNPDPTSLTVTLTKGGSK